MRRPARLYSGLSHCASDCRRALRPNYALVVSLGANRKTLILRMFSLVSDGYTTNLAPTKRDPFDGTTAVDRPDIARCMTTPVHHPVRLHSDRR